MNIFRAKLYPLALAILTFAAPAVAQPAALQPVADMPDGWTSRWNPSNQMLIAQPRSGNASVLFVGLRPERERFDAAKIERFVEGVTGTGVTPTRNTPLRDGAILQFVSAAGDLRAKAMVKQRGSHIAVAVLITSDQKLGDAAALRIVGDAARSVSTVVDLRPPRLRPASGELPTSARLFVGVKFRPSAMSVGGRGTVRYNLLLLPDGTAFAGIPPAGQLRASRESLQAYAPRRVGSWRPTSGGITVDWPARTGALARETYVRSGDGLSLRGTSLKPVSCPAGSVVLNGDYRSTTSQAVGPAIGSPVQSAVYSARALAFSRDGDVALKSESAVSGRTGQSNGAGTTRNTAFGRYTWHGCTLSMAVDGKQTIHTAFFWPGEGQNLLVVDGKTYLRR